MAKRIVITGAGGLVGRVLADQSRRGGREVLTLTSAQCDITDVGTLRRFVTAGDVVVNCAAFTQVDAAEADEAKAHAVNAVGAGNVAQVCAEAGAGLVHLSTDYVFGGLPRAAPGEDAAANRRSPYEVDDDTAPASAYGRTKLAGERAVHSAKPDAYVVRTAWVYQGAEGTEGSDFVATMAAKAAGDGTVDVVADQIGTPTYVGDLVAALLQVADGVVDATVVHVTNSGQASRFDQARATFEALGADPDRVRPVGSDRHPRPAPRPAYSVLSAQRSVSAGLTPLRDWRAALTLAVAAGPGSGPLTSTP